MYKVSSPLGKQDTHAFNTTANIWLLELQLDDLTNHQNFS